MESRLIHTLSPERPLSLHEAGSRSHNYSITLIVTAGFEQQWNINYHDRSPYQRMTTKPTISGCGYMGMNNDLKTTEGVSVGEDASGQCRTVDRPASRSIRESRQHGGNGRAARCRRLAGSRI